MQGDPDIHRYAGEWYQYVQQLTAGGRSHNPVAETVAESLM
jgi:hypothetical protein